jgi:putative transposase
MDDHVHVLVQPVDRSLERIVQTWKSFTAHEINKVRGVEGTVWQPEYIDRIMRTEEEVFEKAHYILNNPKKRWPELGEYAWKGWIKDSFG